MKAIEFMFEASAAYRTIRDPAELAHQYLTQMFSKGIGDRAALASVIDLLHHRGVEYNRAAEITKQAFVLIKGVDVTTE